MYLLDTNVLSDFRKPRPHPGLMAWAEVYLADGLVISLATVVEIVLGAAWIGQRDLHREAEFRTWLNDVIDAPNTTVLPSDMKESIILGQMAATPSLRSFFDNDRSSARPPKLGSDVRIAAAAIANNCTLVTRDISDMLRINDHFRLPGLVDPYTGIQYLGVARMPRQLSLALTGK
jgi:predicted nucleic acid-binding protein